MIGVSFNLISRNFLISQHKFQKIMLLVRQRWWLCVFQQVTTLFTYFSPAPKILLDMQWSFFSFQFLLLLSFLSSFWTLSFEIICLWELWNALKRRICFRLSSKWIVWNNKEQRFMNDCRYCRWFTCITTFLTVPLQ